MSTSSRSCGQWWTRLVPLVVAGITALLAACTTGGTPTAPASVAASTPSAAATAGEPATDIETSEPSPSPTAAPTLSADLVALMPTEIGGFTMTIEPASDPAGSFLILWSDEAIARDLLDSLGKSEDDVDVVFSYTEADVPQINLTAYRVTGADGEALMDGMVANYFAIFEEHGAVVTETTLGGKDVTVLSLPSAPPGGGEHFYAVGDVVFNISANPPQWVEETLLVLP